MIVCKECKTKAACKKKGKCKAKKGRKVYTK